MYYGVDDQVSEEKTNPLDIDHTQFKSDMFMEKVLKECSLNELYQMEGKMKKGKEIEYSFPRVLAGIPDE